jgi:hypothetical protein
MKYIRLNPFEKCNYAIVDDEDYNDLLNHDWKIDPYGYAFRYENRKRIRMNAHILKSFNKQIRHINSNRLDNRKVNLIIVGPKQNPFIKKKRKRR